jgi:hypothetical protein
MPRPLRRRTRVVLAVVGVLALGGAIAGAVGYRVSTADRIADGFVCIDSADAADAGTTVPYRRDGLDTPAQRAAYATEVCGDGPGAGASVRVAHPAACLLDDGRIAVLSNAEGMPAPSFCDAVGLRGTNS